MSRIKLIVLLAALFFVTGTAQAAIPEHTITTAQETHIPIRLKPNKPQLVRLDAEVQSVTVDGAPGHVTAIVYEDKSVALLPRKVGATHITVTGKDGKPLMSRYIVVANPTDKYIRLRNACKAKNDPACKEARLYYCPNFCYETHVMGNIPDTVAAK